MTKREPRYYQMTHEGVDGVADILPESVELWQSSGWVIQDADQAEAPVSAVAPKEAAKAQTKKEH